MPSAIEARIDAGIDAEAQKKVAKESIMHAQQILHACGGYGIADLQHAVALIEAITDPWAQGAAQAQQLVHQLVHRCPTDAEAAMKKANRDTLDLVMLRCREVCHNHRDRNEFLALAAEAYGMPTNICHIQERLIHSCHKYGKCWWASNRSHTKKKKKKAIGVPEPLVFPADIPAGEPMYVLLLDTYTFV